ncbi:unnamed protein product [Allacma fusca]|uniref:Cyclic nucleotide-binding domain-containing protein n=1 Tax=Allacma fusca TaxID=39272 RepID=A0A8J2PE88_9HEXA|nr:unnamed protein product [Allacma fusca]
MEIKRQDGTYPQATDWTGDEDDSSSTGFVYVETTVTIESHNFSGRTEVASAEVAAPEVVAPEVAAPEVVAPEVAAPEVSAPQVAAPEVTAPEDPSTGQKSLKKEQDPADSNNFAFLKHKRGTSPFKNGAVDKLIGRMGNSLPEENLLCARTHRLLSLQKNELEGILRDPCRRAYSLEERLDSLASEEVQEKLRLLSCEFSKRASRKKEKIRKPITPTTDLSCTSEEETSENKLQMRLKEFLPTPTQESNLNIFDQIRNKQGNGWKASFQNYGKILWRCFTFDFILDSQSRIYIGWLVLMAIWFLYNAWAIPLRSIFRFQTPHNVFYWFIADSVGDIFYILDTFIIQSRIMFVSHGFAVKDPKEILKIYFSSSRFKIGLVSLIPVDIYFSIFRENTPWLRLFRLLKMDCFWEMFLKLDSVVASPHPVRITRSILYMLYLIHMYACAYYWLSTWEINTGYQTDWIFRDADLNPLESYIRCFYFATKTATSIGKNPKPENEIEYLFMTCAWLSGVFAFAILIGQIRDIIATATKNQTEYRQLLYSAVNYLHQLDVPKELQERVKLWITYTWQQQRTLDEQNILSLLPQKMQTDIALHVHIEMLNKVKLFQHCEVAFLRDLVPRFRSVIFLPGDFVCRKGEVGKEMYIVQTGSVNVIGGPPGKELTLASLKSGAIFGEIALLQVDGMDKRTADVRSAGFSNLFVLTKKALADVIKDYPAAQESLRKQAKKLLKLSQKRRKAEQSEAKRQRRKFCIVPSDSKTARYIQFGTKSIDHSWSIPDIISSYPPSPFIPVNSCGFQRNCDISLNSSLESISVNPNDGLDEKNTP